MTTARSAGGGEGFCSHLRTPTHRRCALHAAPPDIAVERELRGLNREREGGSARSACKPPMPPLTTQRRRSRTPPPWFPTRHRRSPGTPRLPPLPTQAAPVTARQPACPRPAGPARCRSREVSHSLLAARLMLAQCRSWIGWGDESGWWAYRAGWWEPGWFGLASWWAGWVGWVLGVE